MTNLLLKNRRHVTSFEHHISNQIFFSLLFTNHARKSLSLSLSLSLLYTKKNIYIYIYIYISLSSSKLKFQTRDQQLLHRNGFKADLTTNLMPYSAVKSFVVRLRIMMNCRWQLLGYNEWRWWLQG